VATVEAVDAPVGPHERVLDEVFGVGRVAGQRSPDPQEYFDLGEHILGEGVLAR
jgi:hypothetical protein